MICKECVAAGTKSRVQVGPCAVTCMGWTPYDEEGKYHSHDPNWRTASYSCSNGHSWKESTRSPCPAEGCPYPRGEK